MITLYIYTYINNRLFCVSPVQLQLSKKNSLVLFFFLVFILRDNKKRNQTIFYTVRVIYIIIIIMKWNLCECNRKRHDDRKYKL